jgi:maltose O-acetyltransferase
MPSQKQKMIAGELYDPLDTELSADRVNTRLLLKQLNDSREDESELRSEVLGLLISSVGENVWIQPPFYCDYGYNIKLGNKVFFNFNCVVLDVAQVTIGDRTLIGPNVQIYTATHPMDHQQRASGFEFAKPISIGKDVWIGGSAIVCPGVTIGDRSVIGAGSVITKDIPADVLAAGNPCKVIRQLTENERNH